MCRTKSMDAFDSAVTSAATIHIMRKTQPTSKRRHPRQVAQDRGDYSVAHTITACCRCRSRKSRCDPGLPRCDPCERSNSSCDYLDTARGKVISRTYIIYLQNKVRRLEEELEDVTREIQRPPDVEATMRKAGFVKFGALDEPRFLGPSSGIGMTRLVMALAKQNNYTQDIKDIVPDTKARQIKDRFIQEDQKHTSKIYPLISDVAAPHLPSRELTDSLVRSFNAEAQYLLPTLHEPTFWTVVDDVFRGDPDSYKNFSLRMVIAISMQKLSPQYAGLADSYYLASLPFLERTIKNMDIRTLQSLALIAQYSMVTPTRTAASWVVGLATRLCHEMGICEEATITTSHLDTSPLDALQVDMRRRLFWIITSMEFGLAHSLGRPSCALRYDHINVKYFATVDDEYIKPSGIIPGSTPSTKKITSIHFFRMRLLQAEIRRKLYLRKRREPEDDQDPWFVRMEERMKDWLDACPRGPEGSGINEIWFKARYNTMVIFLHRPSPQIPNPSIRSVHELFEAAVVNIGLQHKQVAVEPIVTWIWTQSLFLALNTVLFCLSYIEIRKKHSKQEVEVHVHAARNAIAIASQRWPGVESAIELYDNLIAACLLAYNIDGTSIDDENSPSRQQSPISSSQEFSCPPSVSSAWNHSRDFVASHEKSMSRTSPGLQLLHKDKLQPKKESPNSEADSFTPNSAASIESHEYDPLRQHPINHFQSLPFDGSLPTTLAPTSLPDATLYSDIDPRFVPMVEHYSQYLHDPYFLQQPVQTLSQQEQMEMMQDLEVAGLRKD